MNASRNTRPFGSEADPASELAPVDAATEAPETEAAEAEMAGAAEPGAAGPGGSAAADAPADAPASENHEAKLARDLEELEAKAEKADEYLELAQRTKADFENYRKRAAREAGLAEQRGAAKLAKELLPALDNLERALAAVESDDGQGPDTLLSGIKLVQADLLAALARVGIEPFSPEGESFDPQHHEAMAQQPVEGSEPGTIIEVYQRGYRLGDHVLRPARVVVAA
jgi:molecular chaperone GrpE